jgi:hypothetical protein
VGEQADRLFMVFCRKHRDIATRIGGEFWAEKSCDLLWIERGRDRGMEGSSCIRRQGVEFHRLRELCDHEAFKDCEAYASDEHFKQFGFATVRP